MANKVPKDNLKNRSDKGPARGEERDFEGIHLALGPAGVHQAGGGCEGCYQA
jgi:hypothetical protein